MEKSNIHIIINELDKFTRRYYLNEFAKGLILFVLIGVFYFLLISCAEYFAFFPTTVRSIVFYTSIALALAAFVKYIAIPFFQMHKIGKVLTHTEAAWIITQFFPEIKDTLLNTLELADDASLADNALAVAAINQKIATLRPIPFESAIDFKKLLHYWKYGELDVRIF